ncbi:MAG: DUF2007 domain-containing protein [Bacteroidales bacterium]|jgi:hypothetical protein|nr:DUF2007 domain-containing protein [Bacteroidales bacterium]MDD4384315.1 DUF2007 domain-containing protein [Bacteroidales bacterium]MDY0198645.1 DUF2007 domain-containing protein [Tenuifilaceae bacterium]
MKEQNWSLVFTTDKPFHAEIIKQMLVSNGIEAVVLNKRDSSYPSIGEAEVFVTPGDETKATKLIEEQEF